SIARAGSARIAEPVFQAQCRASGLPREPSNELVVGWRELQAREVRARHPPHLLAKLRDRIAEQRAREEMELHASIAVLVRDRVDLFANRRLDGELFAELTAEALDERLARIAFAAGKLPQSCEVNAFLSAREQEGSIALDDGCGHNGRRH